jgi:hypothetical protein
VIDELYQIWGIKPEHITGGKFTGYESLYPEFDKFTKEVYEKDPEGTRKQILELYRSINLVPMYYYTEQGLRDEIDELKVKNYNSIEKDVLPLGNNGGQTINRFLFPNMLTALPKNRSGNSLRDRFLNDIKLDRAIRICFEFRSGDKLVYPTAIRRALELVTGENIQNFKSQHARAISEHLCPTMFGRVYDYSSGYGGRMLGTSLSNMRYTYIGIDPNTETFNYLNYLAKLCDTDIELYNTVSEEYKPENIDLAFLQLQPIINGVDIAFRSGKIAAHIFDVRMGYQIDNNLKLNLQITNLTQQIYMGRPMDMSAPRSFQFQLVFDLVKDKSH